MHTCTCVRTRASRPAALHTASVQGETLGSVMIWYLRSLAERVFIAQKSAAHAFHLNDNTMLTLIPRLRLHDSWSFMVFLNVFWHHKLCISLTRQRYTLPMLNVLMITAVLARMTRLPEDTDIFYCHPQLYFH